MSNNLTVELPYPVGTKAIFKSGNIPVTISGYLITDKGLKVKLIKNHMPLDGEHDISELIVE